VVKRIGDSNAEEIRRANRSHWGARNFNARPGAPPDLGAETPTDRTLLSFPTINAARERPAGHRLPNPARETREKREDRQASKEIGEGGEGEARQDTLGVLRRPPQFADPVRKEQKSMARARAEALHAPLSPHRPRTGPGRVSVSRL